MLPPVVTGYFLLILLGRNGPIGQVLHNLFGVDVVFTWVAAALAAGLVSLPLMVRAIEVAMANVDPTAGVCVAHFGGWASENFLWRHRAIGETGYSGGGAAGLRERSGEFGATIVVAGNIPGRTQTVPLALFNRIETGDDAAAVRLIAVSLILAFGALILHHRLVHRRAY